MKEFLIIFIIFHIKGIYSQIELKPVEVDAYFECKNPVEE